MSANCCAPDSREQVDSIRRLLIIALVINAIMFVVEMIASQVGDSMSLRADALDFFSDAANYAISLTLLGSTLVVRARATLVKAAAMSAIGLSVLYSAGWRAIEGSEPQPIVMGGIAVIALAANVAVAVMMFRFREGDSNLRSVWLCSRNDAIGNLAVLGAALGVFATHSRWLDLIVAAAIASLALTSAWSVARQALREMSTPQPVMFDPAA
ncbi:MAG: cation transporter [Gammaproteobacteria bacterium]|nr:cation transporter [Gammaproteobacteria bacterium]|tara:strand:- start:716 stop:1351 length:636 start_codon:yes stop_codon:yes gene_type:complete